MNVTPRSELPAGRSGPDCDALRRLALESPGPLGEGERRQWAEHLRECAACSRDAQELDGMRASLRALSRRTAPPQLTTALRVLASQERQRRLVRASWRSRLAHYREHLLLWRDNLARPFAIPATGGFLSTVLLFGLLVPHFTLATVSANDVPTILSTVATMKSSAPVGFPENEVTVELTIDEQGRVVDYSLPPHGRGIADAVLRRDIENYLLFTQFEPATAFGMPTSGKVRITFRRSTIDVKG